MLPSSQHVYDDMPQLSEAELYRRRETVFLVLAGLFLGTLAMLNILGIARFVDLSFTIPGLDWRVPMEVAVGVLPYPVTFLCTDFISELYGRERASRVVFMGLALNVWVVAILWIGGALPGQTPDEVPAFFRIRELTFGAVTASMMAYLTAQLVDVHVFHYWKRKTNGKHLWLRNNGSTLVSQLVDSTAVILITVYYAGAIKLDPGRSSAAQVATLIASAYVFKLVAALVDTAPFYWGTRALSLYLRVPPPGRDAGMIEP